MANIGFCKVCRCLEAKKDKLFQICLTILKVKESWEKLVELWVKLLKLQTAWEHLYGSYNVAAIYYKSWLLTSVSSQKTKSTTSG
jgi:hypothetical protein